MFGSKLREKVLNDIKEIKLCKWSSDVKEILDVNTKNKEMFALSDTKLKQKELIWKY